MLIVRQIPAHEAFHAAAGQKAIYLPATLAGLAGAFGAPRAGGPNARSPLVLAWFVAAAGMLGVIDAVHPNERSALIASLAPEHVTVSPKRSSPRSDWCSSSLRAASRVENAAHGRWRSPSCSGSIALHLQHRFGYGAIATALVAVALLARRSDFDAPGDPEAHPRIALRALLFGSAIFGYAFGALWINRVMADQSFTLPFVVHEARVARSE